MLELEPAPVELLDEPLDALEEVAEDDDDVLVVIETQTWNTFPAAVLTGEQEPSAQGCAASQNGLQVPPGSP